MASSILTILVYTNVSMFQVFVQGITSVNITNFRSFNFFQSHLISVQEFDDMYSRVKRSRTKKGDGEGRGRSASNSGMHIHESS